MLNVEYPTTFICQLLTGYVHQFAMIITICGIELLAIMKVHNTMIFVFASNKFYFAIYLLSATSL